MKINLREIPVRDVVNGYADSDEEGVVGFGGQLNIRPKFQREFVYRDQQRDAVIRTVTQDFPLNTFYWSVADEGYEMLDGQQRTLSICQYVNGDFSIDNRYFHNLTKDEQDAILNYPLMVYICEGTDSEKLDWFRVINIAGEKLTDQELRNAVYAGPWLTDAKRYFSKTGCAAYQIADNLMKGTPIRQDYLETVLDWISTRDGTTIEDYMATHQHDTNANPLWLYFQAVISWVRATFPHYRREQKGLPWGLLFNQHKDDNLDPAALESRITDLMQDEDISRPSGIYPYVLDGDQRHLNLRGFSPSVKRAAYERQGGVCVSCQKVFSIEEMEADHITPWSRGGSTTPENCQLLCADCNRRKSNV